MLTLDPLQLPRTDIPVSTGWLLGSCMEARGKQDLWIRQKPEVLDALRTQSIIQSVESSNRIEGVTVETDRLRPLVMGKTKPRDRSEEELAGYRRAIDWIFSRKNPAAITPKIILRLHEMAQRGSIGDAGVWKSRNNEIIEILPNGKRKIRFRPTPAKDTPLVVDNLCRNYVYFCVGQNVPMLLVIATFVFDFLCIHPFRDGNGRVSRLLTTLLLHAHGFQVVRYISLERLVEESKDEYYQVLAACSQKWHEGKNQIVPWWNYFLGVVHRAYKEFEQKVESVDARPAKSELIRQTVLAQTEPFALSDISTQLPFASPQLIKKVLAALKKQNAVRLTGRGRSARWEVVQ